MADVRIHKPEKSDTTYSIRITTRLGRGTPQSTTLGFTAGNFTIPHLELWDSFLPLLWLTRHGGPLLGRVGAQATVHADFPLNTHVVEFFENRARNLGMGIDVTSGTVATTYDVRTSGSSVLFGGGKDSRLLLGTLREIGENPTVVSARGARYATDIEGALCFDPAGFKMVTRIVPALMLGARDIYYGSGLGEVHITKPWWHWHYDISSPSGVAQTNELFARVGANVTVHVPQCVLPYNIVQLILAHRYPELFDGQISVEPNKPSEKNLQITLLKRYHGLPHHDHCSDALLNKMARDFIRKSSGDDTFGYGGHREIIHREMRAILFRLYQREQLALPTPPPAQWDAPWIDHIHSYCNPTVDPRLLRIYRDYAEDWRDDPEQLPLTLRRYLSR